MATSLDIHNILLQVEKLDKTEQLTLLKRLSTLLKKKEKVQNSNLPLSAISGIGSEIWKGSDIDKYVREERQW